MKMTRTIVVAVALFSMLDRPAVAAHFVDGNDLYSKCREEGTAYSPVTTFQLFAYCQGYITGIADGILADGAESRLCMPDKVSGQQLFDVVRSYLVDHPEKRHLPAESLVTAAIREKFPW